MLSIMNYAICQINGKQYLLTEGKVIEVDKITEREKLEFKTLLISQDNRLRIGKPYLKEEIKLEILEDVKGEKIRVGKFHAKANYRRVRGIRPSLTKVMLGVKKAN